MVVLGLILNRFNVTLMNLEMRPGYGTYFPTWMEIAVSVGLFSGGMIVIMLANKFLPVMKHDEGHGESHGEKPAEAPARHLRASGGLTELVILQAGAKSSSLSLL